MGDKTVYNVKVYFSGGDYIEWIDVTDMCWNEENSLGFVDNNGNGVSVVAETHVIVVTKKQIQTGYR